MARFYRCRQCGSLEGSVGTFSSEPEDCAQCGHHEFEIVGPEQVGFLTRVIGNLGVGRAARLMTGLAAVSFILTVLLPLVGVGQALFVFSAANLAFLLLLAYGLARKSAAVWWISAVVTGGATLAGLATGIAAGTEAVLGESVLPSVAGSVTTSQAALFVVFSVIYLLIFLNLVGGREKYFADLEA